MTSILWFDHYDDPNSLKVSSYFTPTQYKSWQSKQVVALINFFGEVTISSNSSRKLSILELQDLIPLDTQLTINVYRNGSKNQLSFNSLYQYIEPLGVCLIEPRIEGISYVIVAGMCISQLYANNTTDGLKDYTTGCKSGEPWLVITRVFPGTTFGALRVFHQDDILHSVNGVIVKDIQSLIKVLGESTLYVFRTYALGVITPLKAYQDDMKVMKNFSIERSKTIWL